MTQMQWGSSGEGFEPCGPTIKRLQPGLYKPVLVPRGMRAAVVIQAIQLVTDNLVVLEDSPVTLVTEGIKKFWANREKFEKHGITYKRGILLEGPPGTGKISIGNLIAKFFAKHGALCSFHRRTCFRQHCNP